MTLPGARNLLMSEVKRFERPTATSGPGDVLRTPGGKCCWMMNPAVREVNAFWLLLRYAAVPAFDTQLEISSALGGVPFTLQTASTYPSRSSTAMTLFGEIWMARVVAWLMMVWTSTAVSCAWRMAGPNNKAANDSTTRNLTGPGFILKPRSFGHENPRLGLALLSCSCSWSCSYSCSVRPLSAPKQE